MPKKYDVLQDKILGAGAYSEVKVVIHKGTKRHYAVKIINKRYLCNKEELEMVKREVNIHQVLRHVNIVRLYEVFEDNKSL